MKIETEMVKMRRRVLTFIDMKEKNREYLTLPGSFERVKNIEDWK